MDDVLKFLENSWSFVEKNFLIVVVTIFLTNFFQHRFKKKAKKEEDQVAVKYLALRLAFLFEGYAVECADKVGDHQLAYDSDRHAGRFIGQVPKIPPLPREEDQKILDHSLLNDIWDFPQRCVMANDNALFWDDIGERDCTTNALRINTIKMGFRAMDIGNRLRKKYDLSPRLLGFGDFDVEKFLKEELEKIEANGEKLKG